MSFRTVIVDAERAIVKGGKALVGFIEHLPSEIEHGIADIFKVVAKDVGPAALQAGFGLAEHYVGTVLPQARGLAEGEIVKLVDAAEHTDAFAWVKGELLATGVVKSVPDAHTIAAMALAYVDRGLSIFGAKLSADEVKALVDAGASETAAKSAPIDSGEAQR